MVDRNIAASAWGRLGCVVVVAVASGLWPAGARAAVGKVKPATPQTMFRALGVEDAYFDRLVDGKPLDKNEDETLFRVLFRLRLFPLEDLDRWAKDLDVRAAPPAGRDQRGDIFRLRGRVVDVEPMRPPKEAAERYELPRYYRCRLELDGSDDLADVYTENVPVEWRDGARPDAAAGADGVFLKSAGRSDGRPLLVFAAPRLAWYPNNLLGRLGMDWGLFDTVRDQKPIAASDREAFYEMLAAVGRAEPGELLQAAIQRLPTLPADDRWTDRTGEERYAVAPLFNRAASERGELVELLGTARRIERIPVSDPDIVARFGIDHYYQVSLFTDDSEGNPLTFCIRDLPEGMPYGNVPRYGETVRIAGFLFKTWNYKVPKLLDPALSPGDPKTHRQLSPLLIGRSLVWYPAPKPADNALSGVVVGGLFVLAMLAVWFVAWRSRRRERKWLERMESPPEFDSDVDADEEDVIERRSGSEPDFRRMAEMDQGPETKRREPSE